MNMSVLKSPKSTPPGRKIVRAILLALIATYLAPCAHFFVRQEWYLLKPNADPTGGSPSKLQGEEFVLPVRDEAQIHYRKYITTSVPSKGSVFYLHGNKGNMNKCEWEIEFLIERGYNVWTMDYRGYGDSVGTMSELALKEDAMAVFNKITEMDSAELIIIWGRSFGSGVAASVAAGANRKPKMLVLETPYWSLVDAVRQKYPYLPPIIFRYELPIYKFLKSARCPIHLIHGTQDEKIPPNSSDRLHDLCEAEGIKVTGHSVMCGKHNLRELAEFERITASILAANE